MPQTKHQIKLITPCGSHIAHWTVTVSGLQCVKTNLYRDLYSSISRTIAPSSRQEDSDIIDIRYLAVWYSVSS